MRLSVFRQIVVGLLVMLVACTAQVRGDDASFTLKVVAGDVPHVEVSGKVETPAQRWRFVSEYAGVSKLDGRIEGMEFSAPSGEKTTHLKVAAGEFETAMRANRVVYRVRLSLPQVMTGAAHVSWIDGERGVVMLNDVLPQGLDGARVSFELPRGWKIFSSSLKTQGAREFSGANRKEVEDAVFAVGAKLRIENQAAEGGNVLCIIDGEWAFADRDVMGAVKVVIDGHQRVVGRLPRESVTLMLMPFSQTMTAGRWSAETRGANVLLMMGRQGSRASGLAQLENVLAHETFHLWLPNNLNLQGDYAWFYEGFTLYRALRAGVEIGTLNFQDYLNAIARAVTIYEASERRRGIKVSLVAASAVRWRDMDAAALVYSKAMVVACLYDLEVRWQSNDKRSLDDVFRALVRRHDMSKPQSEASQSVIALLDETHQSGGFSHRFITAATPDLKPEFEKFGLRLEAIGAGVRLNLSPTLSGKQRRLLQRIGMR